MNAYDSNEFSPNWFVSSDMQAAGQTPAPVKSSMKRRSCEVPLGDISSQNSFKVSLGDITNAGVYHTFDGRSIRSLRFQADDLRSVSSFNAINDGRSAVKNFRSSLADFSAYTSLGQGAARSQQDNVSEQFPSAMTSSIEGVLWSDEEENEYFYNEEVVSAWNQDLAAIRQILESETGHGGGDGSPGVGAVACPSCGMPFDKGKKRRLIDACGHERCYACMFHNEACPLCKPKKTPAPNHYGHNQRTQGNYSLRFSHRDPRTEIRDDDWHSPTRLPKPPSRNQGNLAQSSPSPSHSRRRFFLSPKSLRSPFGQRRSNSRDENRVPISGGVSARLDGQRPQGAWPSMVLNKIRSLWSANSSIPQGLNQLAADDEGISVKSGPRSRASSGEAARRSSQSDLNVRLGLLLGDGRRRDRENSASIASLDAHTLASHNTSPVSTLTGSSEVECATTGLGSAPSLASVSLASNSSSPAARRHSLNPLQNGRTDEYNKLPTGLFKNRRTASRRSARVNNKNGSGELKKSHHPTPQLTLRPLFFEVPTNDEQQIFSGRQWLISDMEEILGSSSPGVVITGSPGTGKTALVLQLVQQSCFGRRGHGGEDYECLREPHEPKPRITLARLAAHVVAYHFCQADNNSTCLVGEFVHSVAAQLCQSPRLQAYREYLLNEPHLLSCLSLKECIADPDLAFTRGVIEPLVILRRCGNIDQTNSIILVDGLCEAEYHRPDHGDTITTFLARFVPQMPSWLKVVATVRTQLLELTKQLPYTRLSLDESESVQKDLLDYIGGRIQTNPAIEQNIKSTLGKSDGVHNNISKFSQYLLHLSEGSFLFVKLTLDLCEKGHIVIKSSNYKVVPVSLAQIFLLQFNLRFPTVQSFEKVTHILSVCLAALYPLTLVEIYYSVNSLLVDTFLPWEEFCQRFDLLSDFLVKRIDNTYMFFHPSFREWLIRRDDNESPKFLCDLRAGHCGIAFRLARVQAPLDSEKTMELGHHILKAHLYRNLGPAQLGLCPRDLQATWVSSSSLSVGEAIANMRNIYTPNVKVSRLMLLAGGSANHITDCLGNAPLLCIYAYQGILAMVSLLLEFGANLELTNSQGCTALSLACQRGHTDVAKRLIASGASLSFPDTTEQTPLVHAAKNGHRDTVIYLLGCEGASEMKGEVEGDRIPGVRHALVAAAQNGHVDIVECLLDTAELQCDVVCGVTGETALSAAAHAGASSVADLLLSRGASPRARNARDASPLALASRAGRVTLVTRLLRAGADPDPPAVLAAVSEGHVAILDLLLDNGGDVNSADSEGISALGWACLRARVDVARLLLARGASVGQCDAAGRSPLCLSCAATPELAELLLDHGATLERVDLNGIRPLDRAIGQRNVPVVNCFLRKGAKLGPTTWAMAAGKPEFMLILLNKLLEDGNSLYRRGRLLEASHRYRYALRKLPPPAGVGGAPDLPSACDTQPGVPNDPFLQLHTNLLLNLSRCKRKLNEPSEAVDLAARASALRPSSFECAYALARAVLAHERPADALPHARRALLLAPPGSAALPTLHALQRDILARINSHTHSHSDNRSLRNYDTLSLNMP